MNKENEIYLVRYHHSINDCIYPDQIKVFSNKDAARAYYNKRLNAFLAWFHSVYDFPEHVKDIPEGISSWMITKDRKLVQYDGPFFPRYYVDNLTDSFRVASNRGDQSYLISLEIPEVLDE